MDKGCARHKYQRKKTGGHSDAQDGQESEAAGICTFIRVTVHLADQLPSVDEARDTQHEYPRGTHMGYSSSGGGLLQPTSTDTQ